MAPRIDALAIRTLAKAHAAGVGAKKLMGEAVSYFGRVARAPRKFVSFSAKDIEARVAAASRVTGKPLRADVLSATVLQLS